MRVPKISLLAIQNYGASGTLFLHSLLDGHPHILSLPGLYGLTLYDFWRQAPQPDAASWVERFCRAHRSWFSPAGARRDHGLHQLGPGQNQAAWVEQATFAQAMLAWLERLGGCGRRELIQSVYLAYTEALGRQIPGGRVWLAFPAHSQGLDTIREVAADFPDLLFLYTLREPLQNMGSVARHLCANHHDDLVSVAESAVSQILADYVPYLGRPVYGTRPYLEGYRERTRAIRLEDLHGRSREVLEALCRWLEIPFDEALTTSTFNGLAWWNRPESQRVSGFTQAIVSQRHLDWLKPFDRYRFYAFLGRKGRTWGYPYPSWHRWPVYRLLALVLCLLPFTMEWRARRGGYQVYRVYRLRLGRMRAWLRGGAPPREAEESSEATPETGRPGVAGPVHGMLRLLGGITKPAWWIRDYLALRFWLLQVWWREGSQDARAVDLLPL